MVAGNLNGLSRRREARPIVEQIAVATRKVMADAEFKILVASGFEPILFRSRRDAAVHHRGARALDTRSMKATASRWSE